MNRPNNRPQKVHNYFDFLIENGYIADDEYTTTDSDSDSDSESEESEYLISQGRTRKELYFVLNHAIKHPPKISVENFKCAMCFDRLSKRWTPNLERKYKQIIKRLELRKSY